MKNLSWIEKFDAGVIGAARAYSEQLARFAFFVVFFWFGLLKVLELSPASPLVSQLLDRTMPWWSADSFMIFFGLFEMAIGICFLVARCNRLLLPFFFLHMFTTTMPLFLLPATSWQSFLVPTLEGQYIIKNIVLIALAVALISRMKPFCEK